MAASIKRLSFMAVSVACFCRGDRPLRSTDIESGVATHDASRGSGRRAQPIPELEYQQLDELGKKLSQQTQEVQTRVQGELSGRAQAAVKESEDYSSAMRNLFDGHRRYKEQVTELRAKSRDVHRQHINEVRAVVGGGLAGAERGLDNATKTDAAEVDSGAEVHETGATKEHADGSTEEHVDGDTDEHVDGSHDDEATREKVRKETQQELTDASEAIANGNIDKLAAMDRETSAHIQRLSEEEASSNDLAVVSCFGIMDDPAKPDSDRACGGELVEKCVAGKPLKEVCDGEPTCQSKFVCEASGKIVLDDRGSYKVEDEANACTSGAVARGVCVTKAPMTMKLPPGA